MVSNDQLSARFQNASSDLTDPLRILWPANFAIGLSALLVLAGMAVNAGPNEILVGICCFFAMVFVLMPVFVLRTETILSPLYFLALVVFISMPMRFFVLSSYPDLQYTHWFLAAHSVGDFLVGAVMTLVGLFCISIAYIATTFSVPVARALQVSYDDIRDNRLIFAAIVLFPLALFAIWLGIERSGSEELSAKRGVVEDGVRYADAYWSLLVKFARFAALILLCVALKRGQLYSTIGMLAICGLAIPLFDAFSSQTRAAIPLSLLGFLILIAGVRGKVPWGRIAALVGIGATVFVVMTEIRVAQQGSTLKAQTLQELSPVERFAISAGGAFNLGGFVANSLSYDVIPRNLDYQYGATVIQLFTAPIPRRLWPDKPQALGFVWLEAFMNQEVLRAGGGAQAGLVAEGYLNFGWIGIIIFSLTFGFIMKAYVNSVMRYVSSSPSIVVLVLIWNTALTYRLYGYGFVSGMVELMASIVFIGFLSYFTMNKRVRSHGGNT